MSGAKQLKRYEETNMIKTTIHKSHQWYTLHIDKMCVLQRKIELRQVCNHVLNELKKWKSHKSLSKLQNKGPMPRKSKDGVEPSEPSPVPREPPVALLMRSISISSNDCEDVSSANAGWDASKGSQESHLTSGVGRCDSRRDKAI